MLDRPHVGALVNSFSWVQAFSHPCEHTNMWVKPSWILQSRPSISWILRYPPSCLWNKRISPHQAPSKSLTHKIVGYNKLVVVLSYWILGYVVISNRQPKQVELGIITFSKDLLCIWRCSKLLTCINSFIPKKRMKQLEQGSIFFLGNSLKVWSLENRQSNTRAHTLNPYLRL